jgi:hypothetical protein
VWARAVEAVDDLALDAVEVLARDDDFDLLAGAGFVADDDRSGIWPVPCSPRASIGWRCEGHAG